MQNCLWRQKPRGNIVGLFGTNLFQISECLCVRTFCNFVDHNWLLWRFIFQKRLTNQLFGRQFFVVQQDTFYPRQDKEQVKFYKNSQLCFIVCSVRDEKVTHSLKLAQNWTFQPKLDKIYFFCQLSRRLYDIMQRKLESLECVQGLDIEFIDSLKNNGTKYLLIVEDFFEEICNSKAFIDIAAAGIADWVLFTLSTTFFIKVN